jgi:hypothetical protein
MSRMRQRPALAMVDDVIGAVDAGVGVVDGSAGRIARPLRRMTLPEAVRSWYERYGSVSVTVASVCASFIQTRSPTIHLLPLRAR